MPNETLALRETERIGHEQDAESLLEAVRGGTLPRTLLLSGDPGIGKKRMAFWVAQALLCQATDESGPCGECADCQRARSLQHPDLHVYVPHESLKGGDREAKVRDADEKRLAAVQEMADNAFYPAPDAGRTYYTSTVRALRRRAIQRPYRDGGVQVFVIAEAERLAQGTVDSSVAANALLKLLEEPPRNTFFILTSSNPNQIVWTIRSRMSERRIRPLEHEELKRLLTLSGTDPESDAGREALRHADGSAGRMLEALRDEWRERRSAALELLASILEGDARARYAALRGVRDTNDARRELLETIEHLHALCHAEMRRAAFGSATTSALPNAGERSADQWADAALAAARARAESGENASPRLVLHRMWLLMGNALAL